MTKRIVPPVLPFMSRGYVLSPVLDWRTRLKLILGGRILSDSMMVSQHNPGQKEMATKFFVVREKTLNEAIEAHEHRQLGEQGGQPCEAKEGAK